MLVEPHRLDLCVHLQEPMEFYKLSDGDQYSNVEWADDIEFDTIKSPLHNGHQRMTPRTQDHIVKVTSPKMGDFTWTWYSECIIKNKVAQLFKDADGQNQKRLTFTSYGDSYNPVWVSQQHE